MSDIDFESKLRQILSRDKRYARNAYIFAFQSLEYTLRDVLQLGEDERRHVSAKEILDGMARFAVDQCGFMARQVWESWGIYSTSDWGNVIYNLIEGDLMRQNDDDSRQDFDNVYTFDEVFDRQWSF